MRLRGRNLIMYSILFIAMGSIYYILELLWRGRSHWTMFLLAGLCGSLVGLINEHLLTHDMPLVKQILIGEAIVLPLEFITGVIVNIILGWNVWDYSNLPLNIMGQFSVLFAFVFAPVILVGIFIDDIIRWRWFNEDKPRYTWFNK